MSENWHNETSNTKEISKKAFALPSLAMRSFNDPATTRTVTGAFFSGDSSIEVLDPCPCPEATRIARRCRSCCCHSGTSSAILEGGNLRVGNCNMKVVCATLFALVAIVSGSQLRADPNNPFVAYGNGSTFDISTVFSYP